MKLNICCEASVQEEQDISETICSIMYDKQAFRVLVLLDVNSSEITETNRTVDSEKITFH